MNTPRLFNTLLHETESDADIKRRQREPGEYYQETAIDMLRYDHTLIAQAMTRGLAHWRADREELCFDGIAYSTVLDQFGVPTLSEHIRDELWKLVRSA